MHCCHQLTALSLQCFESPARRLAACLTVVALLRFLYCTCPVCASDLGDSNGLPQAENDAIWRSGRVCGLNSLFLFLNAHGGRPDYSRLSACMVYSDRYTSLADLYREAQKEGVKAQIGKTNPRGMQALTMPVIAHMELRSVRGEAGGHFVLVTAAAENEVLYVDGTTAVMAQLSWEEFNRRWSGYVLYCPNSADRYWRWGIATGGAAGAAILLVLSKLHISRVFSRTPSAV